MLKPVVSRKDGLVMKPTHEEKCEHQWTVFRNAPFCSKCHSTNQSSPEARVDWEKEAREIASNVMPDRWIHMVKDEPVDLFEIRKSYAISIAKALSAAFEKGREER